MIDIYSDIEECIKAGDVENIERLISHAVKTKYPVQMILEQGLIKGIDSTTNELENGNLTVPEVLISSMTMQAGMEALKPFLCKNKKIEHKALIGTVEGDIHDLGKDIVKVLVESIGIEVIDLGVDVPVNEFIKKVKDEKPDILLISGLLTTTINEMDKIIKELVKHKLRKDIVIFIGGKSIDKAFCDSIGADYYFESAIELRKFITKNIDSFTHKKK